MGKEITEENLKDGKILDDRSCTDILMIVVFGIFVIGWIVVLAVALQNGKPSRLLLPENFRGELCGDTDTDLEFFPTLFIPKPSRYTYGLCTKKCPSVFDYVCNNDKEPLIEMPEQTEPNTYYDHTGSEYSAALVIAAKCGVAGISTTTGCTAEDFKAYERYLGLLVKQKEYKCFLVFYSSGSTLYRCLPFGDDRDNYTMAQLAGESKESMATLTDKLGVGSFFTRGFSETKASWAVILICSFTCCIVSMIWIFLLRWLLAPIVYLCIILIFVLLILIGYFAKLMADDLEAVTLPGDTATEDQVKIWRFIEYAAFIAAAVYFVLAIWMLKRIRIAIAIMKEASKAFLDNPGMVIIPPVVLVLLLGITAFFIVMTVYIQTIGEVQTSDFLAAANDTFGETATSAVISGANATSNALSSLGDSVCNSSAANYTNCTQTNTTDQNTTQWTTDQIVKALHAYNFFGFLWVANFCIMFGFFIMAMITCSWYYSATAVEMDQYEQDIVDEETGERKGKLKGTPIGTMCKSFKNAILFHLGTILWGSLLIAIIQFIRALFLYFQEAFLNEWKDNATVKVLIYCINCCLACIERLIKIISKNAFIITIIKNTSFCASAREAMGILINNVIRVGTLATMSTIACFIIKLFIVGCNMMIAYALIQMESLTENQKIESGLFPMVGIFILSMIIASLFVNVYESCVDTIMMAFFIDEEDLEGAFLPVSLQGLVDNFTHVEEARKNYEKELKNATSNAGKDPKPEKKGSDETA